MKKLSFFLIWVMLCTFSFLLSFSQARSVTGQILSEEDSKPIEAVTVLNEATRQSTQSDNNGNFSLMAEKGQVLLLTHVVFASKSYTVNDFAPMLIKLQPSQNMLNDVVVVGYGSQKKANLTGAVATVDVTKTFGSKPLNDPAKALQGIVPGLTIQYGNGGLTAGADIKIRGIGSINGSSRPLILVDNVQTDDLSIINPLDIESISVLKDAASASIYGARAAFGVVLIKTKSGKKNQKSTISYTNNFSWNKPTVMPRFSNPVPELQALNDAGVRSGTSSPETFGMNLVKLRDGIINWQKNYAGKNGTEMVKGEDWNIEADGRTYFYKVWDPNKEVLHKYTASQLHNINISGGSDKLAYYLSAGYSKDGGIIKMNPDAVEKYNITVGLNASVTKWLDVSAKTMYRNFSYDYPYEYQNYWYYHFRWGSYFPFGTYQGNYFRVNSAYLAAASKSNLSDNYQRIDLGATIKITKNLSVRADYTISRDNALRHESSGPVTAWDFWTAGALTLTDIAASQNAVTYTAGRMMVNTLNTYATYQTNIKDHNIKILAGANTEDNENINFFAARKGLLDPSQAELGLTYSDQTSGPSASSVPIGWSQNGHGKKAFAGYFARVNYDYQNKYLLELNGRVDGSSLFPPQDRWAFFPSASAGYRLTEEDFMQPIKHVLSDAKLRVSYGELGNQDVTTNGSNIYLRTMNGTQASWLTSSGIYAQSITQPLAIANSLKWERVSTLDFGADMRFLDSHVGVSIDYYERNTKGMIQSTSVPSTFGTGGPRINAGNFRTRGYEISVDANYLINKTLLLYGSVGFSDSKTVFTKWDNPNNSISSAFNYVGKTYGEIWGFETERYFTTGDDMTKVPDQSTLQTGNFKFGPGDVKYKDQNGDGKINSGSMTLANHGDLKVIGNTQPRYLYNARLGGTYHNFDLDVFIQGVGKRSWWGIGNVILPMYQSLDILYENQLDYWTEANPNAAYPKPFPNNQTGTIAGISNGSNNFYPQTKYLLNLSYCRLKNVALGYSLPMAMSTRYKIQKLRIYLSGENLAELSNVGAPIDPEITDGGLNFTGRTFPFMRSYSFGVQLTF